jgi:hypothetical protein
MDIKKFLFTLFLVVSVFFSGCVTSDQHAFSTANQNTIISVSQANQNVENARKDEEQKFSTERESYQKKIANLEYIASCAKADAGAGIIGYENNYMPIIGKVFEVQQRRFSLFREDQETVNMWNLATQAFVSGNTEGMNLITESVMKEADETAKENGRLKNALENAQKDTDIAIKSANQRQSELSIEINSLREELKQNKIKNEKILQDTINNLNDKNIKEQQRWLNLGAAIFLLGAFILIILKVWLKLDVAKWALMSGIFSPLCFWLSQIVGKTWFIWGFGGGILITLSIIVLIMFRDNKITSKNKEKAEELDVTKTMAQKLITQIKKCDDDTKTTVQSLIADKPNVTVSDLTSDLILDKLNMTKEEVAQVSYIKAGAKLNSVDKSAIK